MRNQDEQSPRITRKERRARRAAKRRYPLVRQLLWTALCSVVVFVFAVVAVSIWVPWGVRTRLLVAETIVSTRHYQYARWITSRSEYTALLKGLSNARVVTSDPQGVTVTPLHDDNSGSGSSTPVTTGNTTLLNNSAMKVISLHQDGYTGDVIFVKNPKLVRLIKAHVTGQEGEYLTSMVSRLGALGGINASGFEDPNGEGWGGIPVGLLYIHGQELMPPKLDENWATAGFTQAGVLVLGDYSQSQLEALNVRDAMQFHPELVVDGQPMITEGDGGMGIDPRTAIGQTKNGTVILAAINGRFHGGSLGATQKQMMQLMMSYGAVNAVAMDGGSSTVIDVGGKIINSPSTLDPNGERHLPDAWIVFPTVAAADAADDGSS